MTIQEDEPFTFEDIYWLLEHDDWDLFKTRYPNRARNQLIKEGEHIKKNTGYLYKSPEETADLILDGRLSNFFAYTSTRPYSEDWKGYRNSYAVKELKKLVEVL